MRLPNGRRLYVELGPNDHPEDATHFNFKFWGRTNLFPHDIHFEHTFYKIHWHEKIINTVHYIFDPKIYWSKTVRVLRLGLLGSSLKWTVLGQSRQFMGVKLSGPNDWNWTVQKGKVSRNDSRGSKRQKLDGPKGWYWTSSGRSQELWLDGLKRWNWTV